MTKKGEKRGRVTAPKPATAPIDPLMEEMRLLTERYQREDVLVREKQRKLELQRERARHDIEKLRHEVVVRAGRPFIGRVNSMEVRELMTITLGLDSLQKLKETTDMADRRVVEWVQQLRKLGVSWSALGTALGITRQSAQEAFASSLIATERSEGGRATERSEGGSE